MAKLNVGVIIGRFQVPELHAGHLKLFQSVLANNDRVVVLLGVSPVDGHTRENPLSFDQRKAMVLRTWGQTWAAHVHTLTIMPLFDKPTNEEWSGQIDGLLSATFPNATITLYGGRQSFIDSYKGKLKVEPVTFYPPLPDAGTDHRAAIKENFSPDFLAGQIYAMQQQFPKAHATVDFALLRSQEERPTFSGTEVLLIQRADNGEWVLPGGFVDPSDENFELAAKRELYEETGVHCEGSVHFVGTKRINDWRYRSSRDKIITTLFMGFHAWGEPRPNPEEVQDYKWMKLDDALKNVALVHAPLIQMLYSAVAAYRG